MPEQVPVDDILAAVREGAIGAETAGRWLEMRLAEARRTRHVRAHFDPATRDRLIRALDDAMAGDEYAHLFPPSAPLGADTETQDQPLVYGPPDSRGNRSVSRQAAAMSPSPRRVEDMEDEELHKLLFGDSDFGEGA